jgi:osmoprotectant transport system substrate-binding protein
MQMRARRVLVSGLLAVTLLGMTSCAEDDLDNDNSSGDDKGSVTVASQSFTEAALTASMYEQLLEDAGYTVEVKLLDSRDAYVNEMPDKVQISADYVGGMVDFLNSTVNGTDAEPLTTSDPAESLDNAKTLFEDKGITPLDPAEATDQNAFFVTKEYAEENSLTTLSDLEGKSIVLAAAPDCKGRGDCEGGLSDVYGIDIKKLLPLGYASAQTFKAVVDGEAQLGETSTTDGTLESQGMVLLEDDKSIQPAQNLVPFVSTAYLEDHADVADVLNGLMAVLTTDDLVDLNEKAGVQRLKVEDVATDYLEEKGLL